VHSLQTKLAKGLVPKAMAAFLDQHSAILLEAGGGKGTATVPSPEDVEAQFYKVLSTSEKGRPAREIVQELGRLANMAQLLTDPSATGGFSQTRRLFSNYADEQYKNLVAVREPLFAASGGLNPRPALHAWTKEKYERYALLSKYVNPDMGAKIGTWDTLSVPFAQMQLGFSAGVNATANLWILAWRAVGDSWVAQGQKSGQ
jgi:hypothetical protein